MKILVILSLLLTGCTTVTLNYTKNCHFEGNKEICEVEETPFTHPGRDPR